MSDKQDDSKTVKQVLDQHADQLPDHVKSKLAEVRQKALLAAKAASTQETTPAANDSDWVKPVLALAACVCLVVPLYLSGLLDGDAKQESMPTLANAPLNGQNDELDIQQEMIELAVLNDDDLEVVENLEFALWLLEQEA